MKRDDNNAPVYYATGTRPEDIKRAPDAELKHVTRIEKRVDPRTFTGTARFLRRVGRKPAWEK